MYEYLSPSTIKVNILILINLSLTFELLSKKLLKFQTTKDKKEVFKG